MAEGRSRQLWKIGSHIMAVIVNSNKWGGQPVHPDKFNPYAAQTRSTKPVTKAEKKLGFDMLRAVFCPGNGAMKEGATNGRR